MPEKTEEKTSDNTSPYLPTFDTGSFAALRDPVKPLAAEPEPVLAPAPDYAPPVAFEDVPSEPMPEQVAAAQPLVVPGSYQFVKRWMFALVVAGVWVVAAGIGAGLYQWWYTDPDLTKRWPVFAVLVYSVATTVAGLLAAMVQHRPKVTAMAIGLMSAPLASTATAAVLYGAYVFGWIAR